MSSTLLLPHAHSFVKGPAVINTHKHTPESQHWHTAAEEDLFVESEKVFSLERVLGGTISMFIDQ
jgi:hypothetical protein